MRSLALAVLPGGELAARAAPAIGLCRLQHVNPFKSSDEALPLPASQNGMLDKAKADAPRMESGTAGDSLHCPQVVAAALTGS